MSNKVESITTEFGRIYNTPEGYFPSITTILNYTSYQPWLDAWKARVGVAEAARISKIATDRGEMVHTILEEYINGINVDSIINENKKYHYDLENMSRNLIAEVKANVSDVQGQEMAVWHPKRKYAGRLDLVGKWKNELAIIDFKTSKHKKPKISKDYYIQATAYALAYNTLYKTRISKLVILITVEDYGVQVFEGHVKSYKPDLCYKLNQFYTHNDYQEFLERIKSNA